jgi:type II secretory pathway pseudopilin PulG
VWIPFLVAAAEEFDNERKGSAMQAAERKRGPSQGHGRDSGYSLIELCLCLGIIGLLSAIAVPRFAGASARYRADAAARRVATDLNAARADARALGAAQTVQFLAAASVYEVNGVASPDGAAVTTRVDLGREPYRVTIEPADLGANGVTYNGFGRPSRGGVVTVRCGGASAAVVLDAASGVATVER